MLLDLLLPDGRMQRASLPALAETYCTSSKIRIRRVQFIAADESRVRQGRALQVKSATAHGLRLEKVRWSAYVPLMFVDSGLTIGVVESIQKFPAGAIPNTQGSCLIATARLHITLLGNVAWTALTRGVLGGVCSHLTGAEYDLVTDSAVGGEIVRIVLSDLGDSCNANCRVLDLQEAEVLLPR